MMMITYERYWQQGKWLHWSVKAIFFLPQDIMGKQLFIADEKRLSLQGVPVEMAIWRRDGSVDVSLSEHS